MSQVAIQGKIWNYQEIGAGEKHGRPQGSPLLVLHGWGRSGNEWVRMAQDLSDWSGRKAYVLDLPGFGGSSLPEVRDIYEYTKLVIQFCNYLEIKKAIVVGHSLGGRVGIVMGARYPELVERLILVDPAGVKPKSMKRVLLKLVAKLFFWMPRSWRKKMAGPMMDEDYRNSPALRDLYRAIVRDDLKNELKNIKGKVHLVWGELDPILPLKLSRVYRQLVPKSSLRVVWGAGHDPHLTKYEQTLAILQENAE